MAFWIYYASAFMIAWTMVDVESIRVVSFFGVMFSIMCAVHKEELLNKEIKAMKRELKRVSRTVGDIPYTQRAGSVGQAERRQAPSPTIKGSTAVEELG